MRRTTPAPRSERSLEFEQRFDGFGAGARDPARWRPLGGDVKVSRRGARERLAQRRVDGRAASSLSVSST